MWTQHINVQVKVGTIQITAEEIDDIIFALKLSEGSAKLLQNFMTLAEMMRLEGQTL